MHDPPKTWKAGDRVYHRYLKYGTVEGYNDKGQLQVLFDNGRSVETLVYCDPRSAYLVSAEEAPPEEPLDAEASDVAWASQPEATQEDQTHGKHWACLTDNIQGDVVEKWLPATISEGGGFVLTPRDPRLSPKPPEDWSGINTIGLSWRPGFLRAFALLVMDAESKDLHVASFMPTLTGVPHTVTLRRIRPWDNGIEAWLDIAVSEEMALTLFDYNYFLKGYRYEVGTTCDFLVAGLAYSWGPAQDTPLRVESDIAVRVHKQVAPESVQRDEQGREYVELDLGHVVGLIPIAGGSPDDYEFHCIARAVNECVFDDMAYWVVRATVQKITGCAEQDFDINIVVPQRVLKDNPPPEVGKGYQGVLWMQGALWYLSSPP